MKKVMLIFLASILCSALYSQNSNSELLKKLVEKQVLTQDEADEIQTETAAKEGEKSFEANVNKIREAFNTPYMRFGGYGLFMYKYSDISDVKHSAEPRAVFLSMRGELLKNVNYFVLGEFTNPMVHEFWAEWTPMKEFRIRGGQMKTPLSLENQLSLTELETVMNTRSVSSLIGMADDVLTPRHIKNSGGRDIGIRANGVLGNNDLLEYTVGLYQGTGINTTENNNSKDFAGTLMFQPTKGFHIGGSAYFGEANYMKAGTVDKENYVRNRWVVSADYQSERFYARAEWMKGKDGIIDREGVYGTALWYFIPKKLNTVVKVDYYNQNKDLNSEVMDYTLGVNYYFFPQCRFQVNYTYSDYSNKWNAINSNTVLGQLQIVF